MQKVYLENFGPHEALFVDLPKNGLFLITGHNGAGKSTVIEAVNWAVWGKTLRGAAMYQKKKDCIVRVHTESGVVERTRSKSGRGAVSFTDKNGNCTEFDTASGAQEALEQMFGPAPNWRRTHVFSSNDPILFSAASDGDKKRLLESLLGLEKFDAALASCRKELADSTQKHKYAKTLLISVEHDVERLSHVIKSQKESLDALTDGGTKKIPDLSADEIEKRYDTCIAMGKKVQAEIRELEAQKESYKSEYRKLLEASKARDVELESAKNGACHTCGAKVSKSKLQKFEKAAADARALMEGEKGGVGAEVARIDAELVDLESENTGLTNLLFELRDMKSQIKLMKSWKVLQASMVQTQTEKAGQEKRVEQLRQDEAEWNRKVDILKYTESVLGLKGVRAHVLSNALGGIESATNAWLNRICEKPIRVRLSSTDKGAMTLGVEGAGGGNGYKGSSGGERRRIDVALLLALADVAAGASSENPGTLFLDEVLDAIDEEGVGLLASALQEVATRRPIILITHSETLAHAVGQFASDHLNLRAKNGQI